MKEHIANFLKGFAIGAANVIPGVSGGTIALITGIFERMINAIKAFDIKALKLLLKGKIKEFIEYTDFIFLLTLAFGGIVSIFSLAKLLDYLFTYYPIFVWAYFFGLIAASVYYVGKTIDKITVPVIISFIAGAIIAVIVTIMHPGKANDNWLYLILCGIISISSMILPGLSGSYVLILMGNYKLIVIDAINNLDLKILIPFAIGAAVGIIAFANILSILYKKYKNETIALLTGFILGSLSILWPWKHHYDLNHQLIPTDKFGHLLIQTKGVYFKNYFPEADAMLLWTILIAVSGALTLVLIESWANKKK